MRFLINGILIILLLLLLFFTAVFFMVELREDKMVDLLRHQVKENLKTTVELSRIDVNLIKKFPRVTVNLEEVTVYSGVGFNKTGFGTNADTLAYLQQLGLELNIVQLLQGKYQVDAITLKNGKLNLFYDNKGKNNYQVWQSTNPDSITPTGQFALNIKNIQHQNVTVHYHNQNKKVHAITDIRAGKTRLAVNPKAMIIEPRATLKLQRFKAKETTLKQPLSFSVNGKLVQSGKNIEIQSANLQIAENIKVEINGNINPESSENIEILFKGRDIPLSQIWHTSTPYFPETSYKITKGKANIDGQFVNYQAASAANKFSLLYAFKDAEVQMPESKIEAIAVPHINGTFRWENRHTGSKSILEVDSAYLQYNQNNSATVNGSINTGKDIGVKANLTYNLNHELFSRFTSNTIDIEKAKVHGKLHWQHNWPLNDTLQTVDVIRGIKSGQTHVTDAIIKIQDRQINTGFTLTTAKNWQIDSAFVTAGSNTISWAGTLYQPVDILHGPKRLNAQINAHTKNLDLKNFVGFITATNVNTKPDNTKPLQYAVNLMAGIDHLHYQKVEASDATLEATITNGQVNIKNINGILCGGKLSGEGNLINKKDGYALSCKASFNKIDINQLFYQFNNFKQSFITDTNIYGQLTGNAVYVSSFDSTFNLMLPSLDVVSNIIINQGKLVNFEPLYSLSNFIKIKELEHISFARLENNIVIRNEYVYIPQMRINSSALSMGVDGKHGFNNQFDYYFQVNLEEILAHKFTSRKKKFEDVGYIVEEKGKKLGIPIHIYGTPEQYEIKYHRRKNIITNDVMQELPKSQFGDTSSNTHESQPFINHRQPEKNTENKKNDNPFIIEWDDE